MKYVVIVYTARKQSDVRIFKHMSSAHRFARKATGSDTAWVDGDSNEIHYFNGANNPLAVQARIIS